MDYKVVTEDPDRAESEPRDLLDALDHAQDLVMDFMDRGFTVVWGTYPLTGQVPGLLARVWIEPVA